MITSHSRRTRVIFIPFEQVLNSLFPTITKESIFVFQADIPVTAKVLNVWESPEKRSFGFLLEDPSFDEVMPGMLCPMMGATLKEITLDRKPDPTAEDPAQTKLSLG